MGKIRLMKSVPHNILGTFCSRYSDIDGYWMFSFLIPQLEFSGINSLTIDLIGDCYAESTAILQSVHRRSVSVFRDQLSKAGLSLASIRSATLNISWPMKDSDGQVNLHRCKGRAVLFRVCIMTSQGRMCDAEKRMFVAPHNPQVEHCSGRQSERSE